MSNINVDRAVLKAQYKLFEQERVSYQINDRAETMTSSAGFAITKINDCIEQYNTLAENLNRLYLNTSNYFLRAVTNIDDCEAKTMLGDMIEN